MKKVETTIDHSYLKNLVDTDSITFSPWLKGQASRFYLNAKGRTLHSERAVMRLFQLTPTHFRGESLTPEEHGLIVQEALVPTKLWVSEGQVYTDGLTTSLSEADKQVVLLTFLAWATSSDFDISSYSQTEVAAISEEREIILKAFRSEYGLERLPARYIIKLRSSLPPQAEK